MRVVTPDEMREIEDQTIHEFGFNASLIIENVGIQGADFIEDTYLKYENREIIILAGHGNNGADGVCIGRHLANRGYRARVFCFLSDQRQIREFQEQILMAKQFGVKVGQFKGVEEFQDYLLNSKKPIIIDAIFGTGIRLPLPNDLFDVAKVVNEMETVIAIDMPTGTTGDRGQVSGESIKASCTIAIGLPKIGYYISHGSLNSGEIVVLNAGFPRSFLEGGDVSLLTYKNISHNYKPRNKFAHKNIFGHCLVVGGSDGLMGALLMASQAALKVGSGLVTAVTWEDNYRELSTRVTPEVMTNYIPKFGKEIKSNKEYLIKKLESFSSLVIGPGMGKTELTRQIVLGALEYFHGPIVVDADGMKVLSLERDIDIIRLRGSSIILTPHIGEFASFVGMTTQEVLNNPIEILKNCVEKTNTFIVLKGACTYIGFPTGEVLINYFPNGGMASGGSGDVLAGIIGGLVGQIASDIRESEKSLFSSEVKNSLYQQVSLGVAVHSLSGKLAAKVKGERAMTAWTIINYLGEAFLEIENTN